MSENELLIEREKLLGRLVEINWYFMAKKYLTTIAKRKKFLTILEKQITQEASASNVIFVEEDGDVYICMIFRAKSIVKNCFLFVMVVIFFIAMKYQFISTNRPSNFSLSISNSFSDIISYSS